MCVVTDTTKAAPNIELSAHRTLNAPTEMRMMAKSTVNYFPLAGEDKGGVGDHMMIMNFRYLFIVDSIPQQRGK